jgi:hypothetical protein
MAYPEPLGIEHRRELSRLFTRAGLLDLAVNLQFPTRTPPLLQGSAFTASHTWQSLDNWQHFDQAEMSRGAVYLRKSVAGVLSVIRRDSW